MSIDMVNDVQDAMRVDSVDDALCPFMDNTVSGKTRTIYSQSRTANEFPKDGSPILSA